MAHLLVSERKVMLENVKAKRGEMGITNRKSDPHDVLTRVLKKRKF